METEFHKACTDLAELGIARVAEKYDEGDDALEFHNSPHTTDVVEAVTAVGGLAKAAGKITQEDSSLLLPAAGWHDVEQGLGSVNNETASREELEQAMSDHSFKFTDRQIRRAGGLVMNTVTQIIDERLVQAVDLSDYATRIIADADVCNIGMHPDQAIPIFKGLYRELFNSLPAIDGSFMKFLFFEEKIVLRHKFHTVEAAATYGHKDEIVLALKSLMRRYCVQ